jgi:hypothetical protein
VAKAVNNIVSPSAIRATAIGKALLNFQAGVKQGIFTGSNFHMLTELRQAFRLHGTDVGGAVSDTFKALHNALSSSGWRDFRITNADAFADAARDGVTGLGGKNAPDVGARIGKGIATRAGAGLATGVPSGVTGYFSAKAQGKSDQEALTRGLEFGAAGAGIGAIGGPALTSALWERAVPTLKVLGYQALKQGGLGGKDAATMVNTTFGGQNLEAIARSKTVQDIVHMLVLAPDWWEGWARQAGQAFGAGGKDLAKASGKYWATTAISAGLGLEGLNVLFNGHPTVGLPQTVVDELHLPQSWTQGNGPGHETSLELTGLYQRLGLPTTYGGDTYFDQKRNEATVLPPQDHRVYADVLGPIGQLISIPINTAKGVAQGTNAPQALANASGTFAKNHLGLIPGALASQFMPSPSEQQTPGLARMVERGTPIGVEQAATSRQPLPAQVASQATGLPIRDARQTPAVDQLLAQAGPKPGIPYGPAKAPYSGVERTRAITLQQHYLSQHQGEIEAELHATPADQWLNVRDKWVRQANQYATDRLRPQEAGFTAPKLRTPIAPHSGFRASAR